MRKLVVSEFMTLDGVMQAPGGKDEDRDGGFEHGGWTLPYWHDDIGKSFVALMTDVDAFLLGRTTYVTHAAAFEPMPPGDPFGDMMNAPKKYVVSKTLEGADLAQHHDHPRQRDRVGARAEGAAGQEHPDRRQQPARARPARARPGGRAAPAGVPADAWQRQAGAPEWRERHVQPELGDPLPDRGSRAPLHAPTKRRLARLDHLALG